MKSIGIDIGGSHIACGIFDYNSNELENKIYCLNKINYSICIDLSTQNFITTIKSQYFYTDCILIFF